MRYINVHVLWKGGKTEWIVVPWGKHGLDQLRSRGAVIIGYHEF